MERTISEGNILANSTKYNKTRTKYLRFRRFTEREILMRLINEEFSS